MNLSPRSFLFVPANSSRKIEKAAQSTADAVILDLEDAIAVSEKNAAREVLSQTLHDVDFGHRLVLLRINAIETPFAYEDFMATKDTKIGGYVLPKVETSDDINKLMNWLTEADLMSRQVYALIESARSVFNLQQIVTPESEIAGLIFGGEDFAASIGATPTPERQELLVARTMVVLAAAANDIPSIDTVYTDFNNLDGLRSDAVRAKQLGFDGKLVIHPKQLDVVNDVWGSTSEEIASATELIEAYEAHQEQGTGVFSFKGQMVDKAIVRRAYVIVDNER